MTTPVTKADLVDALGCFWNAAIGESHRQQECMAFAAIMATGIAAVAQRLEELDVPPAPVVTDTLSAWLHRETLDIETGEPLFDDAHIDVTAGEVRRRLATYPAPSDKITYTQAIGEAGDAYIKSVAFKGEHHLPAQFRWHELWDAMRVAALAARPAPQPAAWAWDADGFLQPAAVTDAMIEKATMVLLGHAVDLSPGVDWGCSRDWSVNEVRLKMGQALRAVIAEPQSDAVRALVEAAGDALLQMTDRPAHGPLFRALEPFVTP